MAAETSELHHAEGLLGMHDRKEMEFWDLSKRQRCGVNIVIPLDVKAAFVICRTSLP